MHNFSLIVGIDVGKTTHAVWLAGRQLVVQNNAAGLAQLLAQLQALEPDAHRILVACEHTGVYMQRLAWVLNAAGIMLWAIHPEVICHYRQGPKRGKSDKADAQKIQQYAALHTHLARAHVLPEPPLEQLQQLFRYRKQLVAQRQQVLNQTALRKEQCAPLAFIAEQVRALHAQLTQQIKAVEVQMRSLIRQHADLHRQYEILCSVPGIGPVTATHLLVITQGMRKFATAKALACYLGLVPFEYSSGTSLQRRPRTSKKAYQPLKADLHQGAMSVIRPKQFFHAYYQRMKLAGKHHLWITNAIAHTMTRLALTLVAKNQHFDPQTFLANKNSWSKP